MQLVPSALSRGIPLRALQREIEIKRHAEQSLFEIPGVVGVGVTLQAGAPAILVMIAPGFERAAIPSEVDDVPTRIEVAEGGGFLNSGTCSGDTCPNESTPPCHNEQQTLPVQMGNATSSALTCDSGTLGFKACHLDSLTIGYVSANHVAAGAPANGKPNCFNGPLDMQEMHRGNCEDPNCSPSNVTFTTLIGTLYGIVAVSDTASNYADAAFVASADTKTKWSIRDIGTPGTQLATTALGACVEKSGRSTGLTWGVVDAVDVTHSFSSGGCFAGSTLTFRESIRIRPAAASECVTSGFTRFVRGGDSGSAVLNTSQAVVGLVFAEGLVSGVYVGYAAKASNVLSRLGLSLDPAQCTTSVTLTPIADAFIAQEQPTTNFGSSSILRIRNTTTGYGRYSFLKFSVPQHGGHITAATLKLRVESTVQQAALYRVNNMVWSENTVNWSNWNSSNPTWTFLGNYANLSTGAWVNLNVTSAVSGAGEITFGMTSQNDVDQQDFYSRNSASVPQLILTYGSN